MFKRAVTVEGIVSGFQKTIDQLNDHKNTMLTRSENITDQISDLVYEQDACEVEASKASTIASKLQEIIT